MKTRYLIVFVVGVALIMGASITVSAQDDPAEDKGADKAHQTLKKMPGAMLKALKLTKEEAAKTTRGEKIKVYMLGLTELKAYRSGDNAKKVLLDTHEIVYPLYVDGALKTAVSIRKRKGGWKTASIGGSEIHSLEPVRASHAKANKLSVKSYYIVRVPGMYLSFLGYDKGKELYLIPTHEHPDVKLAVGKSAPAGDIFAKIKPLAAKYENVLPPDGRKKK